MLLLDEVFPRPIVHKYGRDVHLYVCLWVMLSIIEKCHHKDEIESVFAYSDLLSQVLSETLSHIVVVIVFDRVTIHNTNMDTHTYSHSLMAVLRPCVSTTSCWRLLATRSCAPPNAMLCYVLLCYARCSPLCMLHSTDIFPGMAWRGVGHRRVGRTNFA